MRPLIRGFSLVELLVAIVVALLSTLAIFQTFSVNESYRRTTVGTNDATMNGGLGAHVIEHHLTWAGSGLARFPGAWGCSLAVTRAGTVRLPAASPFPAPFNGLGTTVRLAPALINDGGSTASDQIVLAAGASGASFAPVPVFGAPSVSDLQLLTTVGIRQNDLLLAFDPDNPALPCALVEANSPIAAPVPPATVGVIANPIRITGGDFSPASGLAGYSTSTVVTNLGAQPRVLAYSIGTDPATGVAQSLLMYDLLTGDQPAAIADNIVNLQFAYGVAADATSNVVSAWVHPTGVWSFANLTNGSAASAVLIARVRAVRVAVVARSPKLERVNVSGPTIAVFEDEPALRMTVPLPGDDGNYRYKVVDTTVALRNALLANN